MDTRDFWLEQWIRPKRTEYQISFQMNQIYQKKLENILRWEIESIIIGRRSSLYKHFVVATRSLDLQKIVQ